MNFFYQNKIIVMNQNNYQQYNVPYNTIKLNKSEQIDNMKIAELEKQMNIFTSSSSTPQQVRNNILFNNILNLETKC